MGIVSVLCTVLIVFNIAMWIFFLRRFNEFFSTDTIIDETNERAREIIREINASADRNIELTNEHIRELKKVSAEAERKVLLLQKELSTTEKSKRFQRRVAALSRENSAQGSLFKDDGEEAPDTQLESKAPPAAKGEQADVELFLAEDAAVPKKDFSWQVKELSAQGLPPEEIAKRTGRTEVEVNLVLEMI